MTSGSAQKFVWGYMVHFQKISSNSGAILRNAEERQDFVELGAFELILVSAFATLEMMGSCSKLYCRLAKNGFLVQNRRSQIAKSQIDLWEIV